MNQVVTELFVDARGAEAGSAAYVRAMQVAQQAVDRLRDREQALSAASASNQAQMLTAATSVTRTASAYDRLKASIDPVFAAAKGLERDLLLLDRAVTRLGISEAEQARMLDLIIAKHDQAAAAARRHAAAEDMASSAFGRRGMNDNFAGANIGYQLQDVAVQASMGGINPAMIGLMQGSQMAMSFQGQSAAEAARSLGGAVTGLLNPVMLVSVGLTTAAAAAIQYFTTAREGADDSAKSLEKQEQLIEAVGRRWGDAMPAVKAYSEELKRQKEIADALEASRALGNREFEPFRQGGGVLAFSASEIGNMRVGLADLLDTLQSAGVASGGLVELQTAFDTLDTNIGNSSATGADAQAVQREIVDLLRQTGIPVLQDYAAEYGALADRIQAASDRQAKFIQDAAKLQMLRDLAPLDPLGGFRRTPFQNEEEIMFDRSRRQREQEEALRFGRELDGFRPTPRPNDIERLDSGPSGADYIRSQRERIELLQLENQLIGATPAVRSAAIASLQLEQEIRRRGLELYGEEANAMRDNGRLEQQLAAARAEAQRKEAEARREQIAAIERQRSDFRGFLGDLYQGIKAGDDFGDVLAKAGMNLADRLVNRQLDALAEAAFPTAHLASMSPTAATVAIASLTEEPS